MPKRPASADPKKPHWIVVRMSKWDQAVKPAKGIHYFRHATEEEAFVAARRLAQKYPGKRFSVYGSGTSIKITKAPSAV